MTSFRYEIDSGQIEDILALDDVHAQKLIGELAITHRPQRMYIGFDVEHSASGSVRLQRIASYLAAAVTPVNEVGVVVGPHPNQEVSAPYAVALWVLQRTDDIPEAVDDTIQAM